MSDQHQRRVGILTRLAAGKLSAEEAAHLWGCSERTIRRRHERFGAEGPASVVHGNQARAPANKTADEVTKRIVELAGSEGKYHDFNTCHLQERLAEAEGIQIGRSTLDRMLKDEGVRKRFRSRPRRIYQRRERKSREGHMLQIDASPHDWLEKRGPRMCLLGAIDDATNKAVG